MDYAQTIPYKIVQIVAHITTFLSIRILFATFGITAVFVHKLKC